MYIFTAVLSGLRYIQYLDVYVSTIVYDKYHVNLKKAFCWNVSDTSYSQQVSEIAGGIQ